ncbi:MAG TPA: helix-turn-helix domain-containing protein [Dehalococcoidia bacterium]|nr:helix-turn-helix domain-containing protein [Dehalococcoidia bacterium]
MAVGNLTIFREQYRATIAGRLVPFTYREFELLVLLATRVDRVVPYGDIEEALWGRRDVELRRRMSVLVCRLRRKLAELEPYRIETVQRVGYRLTVPLAASPPRRGHGAGRRSARRR